MIRQPTANAELLSGESHPARPLFFLALLLAATLGILSSAIYVPAIPAMARSFGVSIAAVELTFVAYLLAFASSMLALGPLSDRCGRRPVLFVGLTLFFAGSVLATTSRDIDTLIAARVIQGLGASGGIVVGRAMIRDLYNREEAAKVFAALGLAMTFLQGSAPFLGGHVLLAWGWRADFALVTVFAATVFILAIAAFPQTARERSGPAGGFVRPYLALAKKRGFVAYALAAAGAHAGFHVFAAGAPAVLILRFGIAPQDYGLYAALPPLGFVAGSFVSNRLACRLGIDRLIGLGCAVLVPAGMLMLALAFLKIGGVFGIVLPMVLVCCGSGLVTPNAIAGSLSVDRGKAGAASSLLSFVQMAGAGGATAALAFTTKGSELLLSAIIAALGLVALGAFGALARAPRSPQPRAQARTWPADRAGPHLSPTAFAFLAPLLRYRARRRGAPERHG
jgi:MFS transporter, DHA1 family, multidrug resistance protein